MGDAARAKELYRKALAIEPNYTNAKEARRIVEGKAN
jgi:Tfp pilus assembly protein PilF